MIPFKVTYFYGSKKMWETYERAMRSDIKRKYIERLFMNEGEFTFVIDELPQRNNRIILRRWRHRDERGWVRSGENISITEHYRPSYSKDWHIYSEEERCNLEWIEELNYKL